MDDAAAYLDRSDVTAYLRDAVELLLVHRPEEPLAFMDEYIRKLNLAPCYIDNEVTFGQIHPQWSCCKYLEVEMTLWEEKTEDKPEERTIWNLFDLARKKIEREEGLENLKKQMAGTLSLKVIRDFHSPPCR